MTLYPSYAIFSERYAFCRVNHGFVSFITRVLSNMRQCYLSRNVEWRKTCTDQRVVDQIVSIEQIFAEQVGCKAVGMLEHLSSLMAFNAAGPQRMGSLAGNSVPTWLQCHMFHFQSKEGILPSDVFQVSRAIKQCLVTHFWVPSFTLVLYHQGLIC